MKNQKKDSGYGHILKYTGVFGGIQILSVLIGLVRNKLVAVLLGPGGVGLLSIFNTSLRLMTDTTGMGLSSTATRETAEAYGSEDMDQLRHRLLVVRSWSLLAALLGFVACVLLSPLLSSWSFRQDDYTLQFALLAPVVSVTAITAGELAVLKGSRQLKLLAKISVEGVFAALLISIPLYYIWREAAIVPSLILVALAQLALTMRVSARLFPYRFSFRAEVLTSGMGMLRLGISFMLSGLAGSGVEFAIRSFINTQAGLETVGLYNVAYMVAMVYAGMVFSAMEADYFPRLAAIKSVGAELHETVNKQVEIMVLLAAPLLSFLILGASLLLPLLFSSRFLPAVDMLRLLLLAMYFRSLTLPLEYINLARGNSKGYLLLEVIFDAMMLAGVALGFSFGGLMGVGVAWVAISVINFLLVVGYMRSAYGYAMSPSALRLSVCQLALGVSVCVATLFLEGFYYWTAGIVLLLASALVSLRVLRGKVALGQALRSLLTRRHHD